MNGRGSSTTLRRRRIVAVVVLGVLGARRARRRRARRPMPTGPAGRRVEGVALGGASRQEARRRLGPLVEQAAGAARRARRRGPSRDDRAARRPATRRRRRDGRARAGLRPRRAARRAVVDGRRALRRTARRGARADRRRRPAAARGRSGRDRASAGARFPGEIVIEPGTLAITTKAPRSGREVDRAELAARLAAALRRRPRGALRSRCAPRGSPSRGAVDAVGRAARAYLAQPLRLTGAGEPLVVAPDELAARARARVARRRAAGAARRRRRAARGARRARRGQARPARARRARSTAPARGVTLRRQGRRVVAPAPCERDDRGARARGPHDPAPGARGRDRGRDPRGPPHDRAADAALERRRSRRRTRARLRLADRDVHDVLRRRPAARDEHPADRPRRRRHASSRPARASRSTRPPASARPPRATSRRRSSPTARSSRRSAAACRSSRRRSTTPPTSPACRSTRHRPHSFFIDRYPAGREATLNFPDIDLTWTNDTDAPVLIRTKTDEGAVSGAPVRRQRRAPRARREPASASRCATATSRSS